MEIGQDIIKGLGRDGQLSVHRETRLLHRLLAPEGIPGRVPGFVGQFIEDFLDLGRGQQFQADIAGFQSDVQGRALDSDAVPGGLGNGVGFGVGGSAIVVFVHVRHLHGPAVAVGTAVGHGLITTVGRAGHGAVVSGGQDLFVLHQHRARGPGVAGGPRAHQLGNQHKIFIPVRPHIFVTCIQKIKSPTANAVEEFVPSPHL